MAHVNIDNMPSERQKRAVMELVENGRNKGKALVRAGYSKKTAIAPTKVTESKGFKEASKDIVEGMRKERDRVIKAMSERNLERVDYGKLTKAIDKLTKNIQLLSGEDTERLGGSLKDMLLNYGKRRTTTDK